MNEHLFSKLPQVGAWRLSGAYDGTEVVRFTQNNKHTVIKGTTVGVEEGTPWSIHYIIKVDDNWHFRRASVTDYAGYQLEIQVDGAGSWTVNGVLHPELEGCLDLDLEASVITNTLPVHRLALSVGEEGESAAVYIRINGLAVEKLDQTYRRLPNIQDNMLFDYRSPRFDYHDKLRFGPDGLMEVYPGIGSRVLISHPT